MHIFLHISDWRIAGRHQLVDIIGVPGVVRFASSPEDFMMRAMAVQLRTAPHGFLSGWTAGALAGLRSMHRQVIHVTVPIHVELAMPSWVDVHRSRWYSEADRTNRADGLVVAKPMRMLWGLAAMCNQHRFDRAAEDAWHLGLITPDSAWSYLEDHRCRGKDGVAKLERLARRGHRAKSSLSEQPRASAARSAGTLRAPNAGPPTSARHPLG